MSASCHMLEKVLPVELGQIVSNKLNFNKLYEIRIRAGCPISVNYGGKYYFVNKDGLSSKVQGAVLGTSNLVQGVILRATEHSIYAATKQINAGYITVQGGIRIGICGEVVWDGDKIRAVKNFCSINIRVPHQVVGCADKGCTYIMSQHQARSKNTLIVSPPGAGKTTYLRDIARNLGQATNIQNILIADERSEIAAVYDGLAQLDVGYSTDIVSNSSKALAFEQGIRAMRPDIIIADEISGQSDIASIQYALSSGVTTIASIHANSLADLQNKAGFENIVQKKLFELYIVLSNKNGPGTLDGVYDGNMEKIV